MSESLQWVLHWYNNLDKAIRNKDEQLIIECKEELRALGENI